MILHSSEQERADLRRCSLFQDLSESQLCAIQNMMRLVRARRRHRIYTEGDPSTDIYFLRTGVVKLAGTAPDGRTAILGFARAGDVFGELGLVDESPRDHSADAHEDSLAYVIDGGLIRRSIQASPELGLRLVALMAGRLQQARWRVTVLQCHSAEERVARVLVGLASEHGVADADGILVPLRVSQGEIAQLAGLTRETVNSVLRGFRDAGLVETSHRSLRLRNPRALGWMEWFTRDWPVAARPLPGYGTPSSLPGQLAPGAAHYTADRVDRIA